MLRSGSSISIRVDSKLHLKDQLLAMCEQTVASQTGHYSEYCQVLTKPISTEITLPKAVRNVRSSKSSFCLFHVLYCH